MFHKSDLASAIYNMNKLKQCRLLPTNALYCSEEAFHDNGRALRSVPNVYILDCIGKVKG